jgi:hypothetical protein
MYINPMIVADVVEVMSMRIGTFEQGWWNYRGIWLGIELLELAEVRLGHNEDLSEVKSENCSEDESSLKLCEQGCTIGVHRSYCVVFSGSRASFAATSEN